jgi:hypothetical protein
LHSLKHDDPRISTEHGIKIDSRVDVENAEDSISFNDDGDSNEIDESDSHHEKHDDPRIFTNPGIITSLKILKQKINLSSTICKTMRSS